MKIERKAKKNIINYLKSYQEGEISDIIDYLINIEEIENIGVKEINKYLEELIFEKKIKKAGEKYHLIDYSLLREGQGLEYPLYWQTRIVGNIIYDESFEFDLSRFVDYIKSEIKNFGELTPVTISENLIFLKWEYNEMKVTTDIGKGIFKITSDAFESESSYKNLVSFASNVTEKKREDVLTLPCSTGAYLFYSIFDKIIRSNFPEVDIKIRRIDFIRK